MLWAEVSIHPCCVSYVINVISILRLRIAMITIHQGKVTAKLSEVSYRPARGFQEDNTWHVAEEAITAEADTPLITGLAMIRYGRMEFEVTVTVFEVEMLPGEVDEENEDCKLTYSLEIEYEPGLRIDFPPNDFLIDMLVSYTL